LTSDGTHNYSYDNNGNLATRTSIATGNQAIYTYDFRNRLVEVDQVVGGVRSVLAQYTYDALDRRMGVSEGGATTSTVYDGTSTVPLLDFNGSGSLTARYLSGATAVGVDGVLARDTPSGEVAWYLTDRLGSVGDIINNAGTAIDHLDYSAFGHVLDQTSPSNGDRFQYAGMQNDVATGLSYDNARWYTPEAGRFISQDPTGFVARDADLYRYVGNNPTNDVDPTGLSDRPPLTMTQEPGPRPPRPVAPQAIPAAPEADDPPLLAASQGSKIIKELAKKYGLNPYDFRDYVHDNKAESSRKPSDNLTYKDFEELAQEMASHLGKKPPSGSSPIMLYFRWQCPIRFDPPGTVY
jgi:RHS repeat-associated protein